MVLTYENLLRFEDLTFSSNEKLQRLNTFTFLSFQDALHYLIRSNSLNGKTILIPSFYCDATICDMRKHGLRVVRCRMDRVRFDVDMVDFVTTLRNESPDIVLIYYFFGKTSALFQDRTWLQYLKPDGILISDCAHALLPQHHIEFITERHVYIDSTRKSTSCMMAHLVTPDGVTVVHGEVSRYSLFRYAVRALFWLKSSCLRLATLTGLRFLSVIGDRLFVLHDNLIGSATAAFAGFWWDAFIYRHIDFDRIKSHRTTLSEAYHSCLAPLADAGHLELFDLPIDEAGNLCFFFCTVADQTKLDPLLTHLSAEGYWVEALWDFSAQDGLTEDERAWASRVIVFPYSLRTQPSHVNHIASLMKDFLQRAAA